MVLQRLHTERTLFRPSIANRSRKSIDVYTFDKQANSVEESTSVLQLMSSFTQHRCETLPSQQSQSPV